MGEGEDVNAQVVGVDYLFAQSGVAGKLVDNFLSFFRRDGVSLGEGQCVIVGGPLLYFLTGFVEILLELGCQFFVVGSNRGVAGEQQDIRLVIRFGPLQSLEVQDHGKQRDAVERDAALRKVAGDARGAGGAVTLSQQKQR